MIVQRTYSKLEYHKNINYCFRLFIDNKTYENGMFRGTYDTRSEFESTFKTILEIVWFV